MEKPEQLLQEANNEIKSLRRQNELMSARLAVYDEMMALLYTNVASKGGGLMHPDIVHQIEKYLEQVKQQ